MGAIKVWTRHPDKTLSLLCGWLVNRELFKVQLSDKPFESRLVADLREQVRIRWGLTEEEADYLVFTDTASLKAYDADDEEINILFKDGQVRDISSIDNALVSHTLARPIKKFYICHPKI